MVNLITGRRATLALAVKRRPRHYATKATLYRSQFQTASMMVGLVVQTTRTDHHSAHGIYTRFALAI